MFLYLSSTRYSLRHQYAFIKKIPQESIVAVASTPMACQKVKGDFHDVSVDCDQFVLHLPIARIFISGTEQMKKELAVVSADS